MSLSFEERNERYQELKEEFLTENDSASLFNLTEKAKAPMVVGIRGFWKNYGTMSDKQRAVLAGWLAEQELEYGDETDE